jgi:nucleotide-binding universal stress UspA family protein
MNNQRTAAGVLNSPKITPPISVKRILLATDFSDASLATLPYVEAVADYYGSEVYAVHAVGTGVFSLLPRQEQKKLLGEAEPKMREFFSGRSEFFSHCKQIVRGGDPAEVIRQLSEGTGTDLLVLGTNGRKGLKRFVLGSVAEEIFRLVPWPVLTVGPKAKKTSQEIQFRHILFATDLAPSSVAALPCAIRVAHERQAALTLLSVTHSSQEKSAIGARLKDLIPAEAKSLANIETLVRVGSPASAILRTTETVSADLIILGVRGGGTWGRAATHAPGPVAYNVIAQAPCPVLTIRSQEKSGEAAGRASQ